jgi:serine/threonine protein kinase
MRLVCPHCRTQVEAKAGPKGTLVCANCAQPIPKAAPAKPKAVAATPPTGAVTKPDPGASGIGQAISDKPSLGAYTILGELGRGGMGRVYKAVHKTLRQVRALKVLNKNESRHPNVVARFQREARIVAALDHPHIVKIFEFDQDAERGYYYIVMEYVDGGSVSRILKRQGKLPWQQAAEITLQVALGLAEMHKHSMVHRDIKPSNILIDKLGSAKLADLGLARHEGDGADTQLTATGAVMGTFDYMSPEQIVDARKVDIRSDLYALGCTLFQMLAGRVPFHEGSAYQKIQQQISDPLPEVGPLAPDVPFQLVLILNRLTEKDPANRYQTPEELIADLETLTAEAVQTDNLQESTIMQLQALAESAAKDRGSVPGSPGSTGADGRGISRIARLPSWVFVVAGALIGGAILVVIWFVLNSNATNRGAKQPSSESRESETSTANSEAAESSDDQDVEPGPFSEYIEKLRKEDPNLGSPPTVK